jgi:hypothetical protein
MNERIKELAEQAEQYALDKANKGNDEDYDYSFDDDFQEKFAELIVRECAKMVRKNNYQFMSNEQHYGVTSGDILNHFGVTE